MSRKAFEEFRAQALQNVVAAIAEPVTDYPRSGPGVIIPMSNGQKEIMGLPRAAALLVLAEEGGQMTVCPFILFPFPKIEEQAGDLWLESEQSPFRSLPGTGRALVRTGTTMTLPVYYTEEDVVTGPKPEILAPFVRAWRAMDQ